MNPTATLLRLRPAAALAAAALLSACAGSGEPPASAQRVHALTESNALLTFDANRPGALLERKDVQGLPAGETLLAIDFRPATGMLYAAGSAGRLYTLDPRSGAATRVGGETFAAQARGELGFDFNPVVDRIRVVDAQGANLRLHPDTGAVVDAQPKTPGVQTDWKLAYAIEDPNEGKTPRVVGAAYTNRAGSKWTTNYAIDAAQAVLVTQGTREGQSPAKPPTSPNSGRLYTVGPLGVQQNVLRGERIGFDIAPQGRRAYASFGTDFYAIDLATGAARRIGTIGSGEVVRGIALAP